MSITDELRKWGYGFCGSSYEVVNAIADRIDAEHEAKVSYWQGASYKDGYDEGFASADDWLAQHEGAMAEHGWVRLPKDADGEYIRIGDVLTDDAEFKSEGVVECLMLDESGWMVGFGKGWTVTRIHEWHHCHAPTVEDVLREFALAVCKDEALTIHKGVVEEFAAKLRLAEGKDA